MSGKFKEVQTCILEKYPMTTILIVHHIIWTWPSGKLILLFLAINFQSHFNNLPLSWISFPRGEITPVNSSFMPWIETPAIENTCSYKICWETWSSIGIYGINWSNSWILELSHVPGGETATKADQLVHVCTSFECIHSCTVREGPSALSRHREFNWMQWRLNTSHVEVIAYLCYASNRYFHLLKEPLNFEAYEGIFTKFDGTRKINRTNPYSHLWTCNGSTGWHINSVTNIKGLITETIGAIVLIF